MDHAVNIGARLEKPHVLAKGHLPVQVPRCVLDPVGEVKRLVLIVTIDEAGLELLAKHPGHVVCEMLLAENGGHGEELLIGLEVARMKDIAARAEDVLETLALRAGVGDFIEITLSAYVRQHLDTAL